MIYSLRKLIAFVFLGGMFWFIYQDLDNLSEPWFMHALGLITISFAFFWLLIPMVVVQVRIRRRRKQNMERYNKWLAAGGVEKIHPRPARGGRGVDVKPDEQVFFHEKGTLYITIGTPGSDAVSRPVGRPSDVAFPGSRRDCHVCQRTHFYVTNHRIAFEGKDLACSILFADLKKIAVTPGGMVFNSHFAFTFQNPLVVSAVLSHVRDKPQVTLNRQ